MMISTKSMSDDFSGAYGRWKSEQGGIHTGFHYFVIL